MSGKSRALAVAVATVGIIALWASAALAGATSAPLVNGGVGNVYLGSNNTATHDTCNNTNEAGPLVGNALSSAVGVPHNSCMMAGGPAHL